MATNRTLPRLLTVRDVAEVLGVSKTTAYRYISDGLLPAVRLREDGPLRIRGDTLERWLAENTNTTEVENHG